MRAWWIVVLAACGGGARNRIVAGDVFTVDVGSPARDLEWQGVDSRVGGYAVGNCTLSYDQGMYQGGLRPDGDEADWQYRVTRVDGRPVRWARYTKAVEERTGPYWLAVYVPGLAIDVACPTSAERDAAIGWFETLRFGTFRGGDLTGTKDITGPTAWSPAPPWCEQIAGPPVGGSSQATLVIEPPQNGELGMVIVSTPGPPPFSETFVKDEASETSVTLALPAGTYAIDVQSMNQDHVTCPGVELRPGQETVLRVLRFAL